ncbi:MAG: bifunctional hydroxymethylpyrimidine kinase/phosphomethylpyrimidine kinase [Kiloniellales bacterium]
MTARVLIVAGSDSGGGAGIQADIKTVTALGGYAMTAVTALTAQNTEGVHGVVGVAPDFIQQQMRVVLDDIGADAIKTGMLHTAEVIEAVCEVLGSLDPAIPLVADPVMVAQSGDSLLEADAVAMLIRRLAPRATVLTPNVPEAERLAGQKIRDVAAMTEAAGALLDLGPSAVLLKGGHLGGEIVTDVLATHEGIERFESPRLDTRHTHGTGCTLASAIATGLAQRMSLRAAVIRARAYLQEALRSAPGLGKGHGPVNHGHTVKPFDGGSLA